MPAPPPCDPSPVVFDADIEGFSRSLHRKFYFRACRPSERLPRWPEKFLFEQQKIPRRSSHFVGKRGESSLPELFSPESSPPSVEQVRFFPWVDGKVLIDLRSSLFLTWNGGFRRSLRFFEPLKAAFFLSLRRKRCHPSCGNFTCLIFVQEESSTRTRSRYFPTIGPAFSPHQFSGSPQVLFLVAFSLGFFFFLERFWRSGSGPSYLFCPRSALQVSRSSLDHVTVAVTAWALLRGGSVRFLLA